MKTLIVSFLFVLALPCFAGPLPIEDFVKHGDYLNMKLSPDGKHMLARARIDDKVVLLFMRSADGKVIGGIKAGAKDEIHTATWVNNERVVYEFAEKHHYFDAPIATGELFATNIDGSKRVHLYGYRAGDAKTGTRISKRDDVLASQEVLSILPDDPKHILIIEYPWTQDGKYLRDDRQKKPIISKLNIYSGRKRKLEVLPHKGAYALSTKQGDVLFMGWTDEQNRSHAAYRKNPEQPWLPLSTEFEVNQNSLPFAFNADASKVYLTAPSGEQRIRAVYELDLQSGKADLVFGDLQSDLYEWIKDPNTDAPAIGISYPDKYAYHYTKPLGNTGKLHKMLARSFAGQKVDITSTSKDGNLALVHVSSDINPGEYYIFDVKQKHAQFVWANRSWIDPRVMQPKQPIQLQARDGTSLHGYLTMPAVDAQKPPMVVMIHGGPRSRDLPHFDWEVQMLANRGYAVLQVNFRGSKGYGQRFMHLGDRQWGGKMIDDIIDATQWALDQDKVDPRKVCVYGASYGGYAALMSAARAPELFRCTIGYVGVYDLNYMFTESDIPGFHSGKAYLHEVLGDDKAEHAEYSPINHAEKIKAAVMLIHGDKDKRVSVVNTKDMQTKLEQLGKQVTTLRFKRSGHGVYDVDSRRELYNGMLGFLDQHIGS